SDPSSEIGPSCWARSRHTSSDHTRSDSNSDSWIGTSAENRTWSRRSRISMPSSLLLAERVRRATRLGLPTFEECRPMPRITFRTSSPAEVRADVVALPMFEGPLAGPGVEEAGAALGEDLLALYRSNKLR